VTKRERWSRIQAIRQELVARIHKKYPRVEHLQTEIRASGMIAIIGGPDVFDMFMDRYDTFWLSEAPHVRLAGGEGCFVGVPARTPHEVLASHGMRPGAPYVLDAAHDVTVTPWRPE